MEEKILAAVDSQLREEYSAFKNAIAAGNLMEPVGSSANDIYKKLSEEASLAELHDHMRRTLAVALQDQIQKEKNELLKTLLSD